METAWDNIVWLAAIIVVGVMVYFIREAAVERRRKQRQERGKISDGSAGDFDIGGGADGGGDGGGD